MKKVNSIDSTGVRQTSKTALCVIGVHQEYYLAVRY